MLCTIEGKSFRESLVSYLIKEELDFSSLCFSNIDIKGCTLVSDITSIDLSLENLSNPIQIFVDTTVEYSDISAHRGILGSLIYFISQSKHYPNVNFYFLTPTLDCLDKIIRRQIDYRYFISSSGELVYYREEEVAIPEYIVREGDTLFIGDSNV